MAILLQVVAQLPAAAGMAQARQRFLLDLANALAGQPKHLANFLQRIGVAIKQPVTQAQDALLARLQRIQQIVEFATQQGLLGAFLFMVPAIILSGFATPIANMPEAVQWLTYINPLRYFLIVLRGVFLQGDSYALLMDQYWPMALIGLVSLILAGWLFRHRMY